VLVGFGRRVGVYDGISVGVEVAVGVGVEVARTVVGVKVAVGVGVEVARTVVGVKVADGKFGRVSRIVGVNVADSEEMAVWAGAVPSPVRGVGSSARLSSLSKIMVVLVNSLHAPDESCDLISTIFFPGIRSWQVISIVARVWSEAGAGSPLEKTPFMYTSKAAIPMDDAPCAIKLHGFGGYKIVSGRGMSNHACGAEAVTFPGRLHAVRKRKKRRESIFRVMITLNYGQL